MKDILIQLKGKCEFEFERDVQSFYHDWNYPNNTGMITVVFERDITTGINQEPSHEFNCLIDEVTQISIIVQKKNRKNRSLSDITKGLFSKERGNFSSD